MRKNLLFSLICIRFGTCKVRRLNRALYSLPSPLWFRNLPFFKTDGVFLGFGLESFSDGNILQLTQLFDISGRQTKSSDKFGKRQKLVEFNEVSRAFHPCEVEALCGFLWIISASSNPSQIVAELTNKLPPYQFLTAFSLLISRICHANLSVFQQLKVCITKTT